MHDLLLQYSRWYQKKTGHIGYLWQGRYKANLIDRESYMLECGRYIERNPVRAGIVTQAEQYLYSSSRYYVSGEPDPLVEPDPYYENMGNYPKERQSRYREFLQLEKQEI